MWGFLTAPPKLSKPSKAVKLWVVMCSVTVGPLGAAQSGMLPRNTSTQHTSTQWGHDGHQLLSCQPQHKQLPPHIASIIRLLSNTPPIRKHASNCPQASIVPDTGVGDTGVCCSDLDEVWFAELLLMPTPH
jgi:hypothetical protein